MKPKQLFGILFLLVGTILSGCNHSEVDDKNGETIPSHPWVFEHYDTIYIDSTATACGIDSCVLYLPWLNNKINTFLKDSAERKQDIVSSMEIDMLVYIDKMDSTQNTYYCCRLDDYIRLGMGTLWFNCEGDTIWKDPGWIKSEDPTITVSDTCEYILILDKQGISQAQKTLVHIELGIVPGGE